MRMKLLVAAGVAALISMGPAARAEDGGLPVGDGKISSGPEVGSVFACPNRNAHGMGAMRDGPWLRDGRWYPSEKPAVAGDVAWPDAHFSVTVEGDRRHLTGNGLPSHPTGTFPVSGADPAAAYDRNPNHLSPYTLDLSLPASPEAAETPHCVPMGVVGIMLTGAALFNALDDLGRDAPAHEIQDKCNGHPEQQGIYHYHGPSPCVPDKGGHDGQPSDLIGYALDGFGIYGPFGEGGQELHTSDLDACHGLTSPVMWDGKRQTIYHYVITRDYPYTIGCFRGTPVSQPHGRRPSGMGGAGMPGMPGMRDPHGPGPRPGMPGGPDGGPPPGDMPPGDMPPPPPSDN